MEVKLKDRLKSIGLSNSVKNLQAISQRITKRLPIHASGAPVAGVSPYEVSEAHKTAMLELERKRSQTSAEAYHQNPR